MNIMVLTAHCDDLEISCAGYTMMRLAKGDNVTSVVVATARSYYECADSREVADTRRSESIASAKVLGIERPVFLNEPIAEIHADRVKSWVCNLMRQHDIHQLITHFPLDPHYDHTVVGMAGIDILQNTDMCDDVKFFKSYNCYSFIPDETYDVTPLCERKAEALRCFPSQGFSDYTADMVNPTEQFLSIIKREG